MPYHLKELWGEWELRVLVLLSLTIQVLLILLGHRRKFQPGALLKGLVWLCYLLADWAAIYALGKITTQVKQMQHDTAKGLDPDAQMAAFWAPFLLLHLGGPDTITAYALEDNEFWLRRSYTLTIKTAATLYIFFQMLLIGSERWLWMLSLLIITSGFIKCYERVYVLRATSSKHFRDSIPDRALHYSKILEEYKLKKAEGYDITQHEVMVVQREDAEPLLSSPDEDSLTDELRKRLEQRTGNSNCGRLLLAPIIGMSDFFRRLSGDRNLLPEDMSKRNRAELVIANDLIDIFRRLFADLVLSSQDGDTSLSTLRKKHHHVVFRVIEIELGFIFDLFYTKAKTFQNPLSFALRIVSIQFTFTALVLFSLSGKGNYSKINVSVTYVLLGVATFLEIYALFVLLISDKAACWLMKHHWLAILDFVERLKPLYNRRRWSGSMRQYNLISFALKEKNPAIRGIQELPWVGPVALKSWRKGEVKVSDFLKKRVLEYFTPPETSQKPSVWNHRGGLILEKHKLLTIFKWSIELEFDQSILVWHIATQLLCLPEYEEDDEMTIANASKMSKHLSRYMLYLLVEYPFLLPVGVGSLEFRDMYAEAMSIFNEKKAMITDITQACNVLRDDVNTEIPPMVTKGDKSKFALYKGCRLASQLNKIINPETKWDIISSVWLEMMGFAAVKCRGREHTRQLQQGGQFLTHVWLLMAHFGLTDHFQILTDPAIAELLVRED